MEPLSSTPTTASAGFELPAAGFAPTATDAFDATPTAVAVPKRSRRGLVVIVLLAVALLAALAVLALALVGLQQANATIKDQNQQLDKQRQLIDKKETFSATMQSLLKTASALDGVRLGELVPISHYQAIATQAWYHRADASAIQGDIQEAKDAQADLEALQAAAVTQASANASGTAYEATIDALGGGYVSSSLDDADAICERDVLACVTGDDPYTVHFDAKELGVPYLTDFIQTGTAYHEFAHSLQFTNPDQTETAVAAFGGDVETMADCFALTYLDGWALHQEVFVSSTTYYEVDLGYGYTCNDDQKAVIRTWYESLPITVGEISQ